MASGGFLGGGYHFDAGIGLVRVGSGARAEEGSGVFVHCLHCLLESGFWKKNPTTRHLCLCEGPWWQVPESGVLFVLFVLHQRCGKARCFLK